MNTPDGHPMGRDGKPLHTFCWGPDVKGREHQHPLGVPMRERGQCLHCDARDPFAPPKRAPK